MSKKLTVSGSGGGGGGGGTYTPIEQPNNLQANTTARLIDVLCEGVIEGGANGNEEDSAGLRWKKSIYFDETPVINSEDKPNFTVAKIDPRNGLSEEFQHPLEDFDAIDSVTIVNTELRNDSGPFVFTINDLDVDSAYVSIEIPALLSQADNGDLNRTTIKIHIDVNGDDGAGDTEHYVTADGDGLIHGKNISKYRHQFYLGQLYERCGVGPWVVTVYRDTVDSDSAKLQNKTFVYSYTESKEVRMSYPDTAVVGLILRSDVFGDKLPSRAYKIRGRIINVPDNYTPDKENGGGTYDDVWSGDFQMSYSSNPAWVLYDILTNQRFGLGEHIDRDLIDKWALYTIGQYCDETVEVVTRQRLPGGGYTDSTSSEPRFTFNGPISTREQALAVVNHICSVFRGYPMWSSGFVSFVQDSPKDVVRIATQSNVKEGLFEYSDTEVQGRTTAARVTYNNMDLFGKPDIVTVEDEEAIQIYGYNPVDIHCFGCTSRSEAIRRAKYILNTDLNQTEFVRFIGGLEWADAYPGEIIGVQDKDYVSASLSGRVVSGTTTSVTVDRTITIEGGETYTLYVASNDEVSVVEKTLTNAPGDTTTLTWSGAVANAPYSGQVWAATKASVNDIRKFQITGVKEIEEGYEYEIEALKYNENKYAEVEEGFQTEVPPDTNLPVGKLDPPSNIQIQPYTYTDGDKQNRKYGAIISWIASPDPRTSDYEIQAKLSNAAPFNLGTTGECMFDWKDVPIGTYAIKVRARSGVGNSSWITYSNFTMVAATTNITPPTNVRTIDDPDNDQFEGPDCEIEWDGSAGGYFDSSATVIIADGTGTTTLQLDTTSTVGYDTVAGYKIEVYTVGDDLLRTFQTEDGKTLTYNYTYNMNRDDNDGSPIRQIKFKVYTIDRYDQISDPATLVASNPAPDMSSTTPTVVEAPTYLRVSWTPNSDKDMSYYKIYGDDFSPPTTEIGQIAHPGNLFEWHGLTYGSSYYFQIEPYDGFGVGTKSVIPAAASPTKIPSENIDVELQASIDISDSLSTAQATLIELYDGIWDSGGVAYTSSDWVQYDMSVENFINGVQIWASASTNCYFELEREDGSKTYYGGNGSHELELSDDQYRLTEYGSLALAQTNYWTTGASGYKYAFLPNGVVAQKAKFYTLSSSTVYELVFRRIVVAEDIAVENLSAISADIGNITTGIIQSAAYPTSGLQIDIDAGTIVGSVEFLADSSGYSNLTDAPVGVEDYATAGATFGVNISGGAATGGSVNNDGTFNLSTDGKTTINGSRIEVKDGSDTVRVRIGNLS
jgi:predicted phage tail protein